MKLDNASFLRFNRRVAGAILIAVVLSQYASNLWAAEAPVGVAAPAQWLAPGTAAERKTQAIATMPDGTRVRVESWVVTDMATGEPAERAPGVPLSGVYAGAELAPGSWSCAGETLEGDCLPVAPGDRSVVIALGEWQTRECLSRDEYGCAAWGDMEPLEALDAYQGAPPAPGVTSVAWYSPGASGYMRDEVIVDIPNGEQDQITGIEFRLHHPDTGALEHVVTVASTCDPGSGSNLCVVPLPGACMLQQAPPDAGYVFDWQIHVASAGGVTSSDMRRLYSWCP